MSLSKASKQRESFLLTRKRLVLRHQALERPQLTQADSLDTILVRHLLDKVELRKDIPHTLNGLLAMDDLLVVMEDPLVTADILKVSTTLSRVFLLEFPV